MLKGQGIGALLFGETQPWLAPSSYPISMYLRTASVFKAWLFYWNLCQRV